ncbi:chitinase N-terminal domain-containing protein [Silvimonas amylolytica]|uniref:Chitinase A N-terminal domain-containing protein n=1 Tax=Silvimonas amylolytica TaxID=449663 RepID=A0ABQ2PG12_9NEIS|nr:chitinase N-terminal domain-containing protein [Silvimonas amylolytica]GGP24278.1 hypothetical protein GCM10010971_00970 [Silvimonas amylolytica]
MDLTLQRLVFFALCSCWLAIAHATLMTQQEAASSGNRACKPAGGGMVDCIDVETPPAAPANDPSIQPLPAMQYPGESIPAPSVEPPIKPALDDVPAALPGNQLTLGWDINFGTTAQYWEIWDNGELRVRTQSFTQRTLLTSKDSAAKAVSVQSGVYTLADLAPGRHEIQIRLCNTGTKNEPVCTLLNANTWVGGAKGDGKPSAPEIEWLPAVTTGEPVKITWHLWWGTPGHYWQVVDDKKVLFESTAFGEDESNSQMGETTLTGLAPGKHNLSVRLCTKLACTPSEVYALEVVGTQLSGIVPQLALGGSTADSYILAWSLPVAAAPNAPLRWQLFDADSKIAFGDIQKHTVQCQQGVEESAQTVSATRSYCGRVRILRAEVPVHMAVQVCFDDDDCRVSQPLAIADAATAPQPTAPAANLSKNPPPPTAEDMESPAQTPAASMPAAIDQNSKPFDLPDNSTRVPAK